jgi:hypothetical protein
MINLPYQYIISKEITTLRESKPFCAHSYRRQKCRSQLLIRVIFGQVNLIKTGMTLWKSSLVTEVSDNGELCGSYLIRTRIRKMFTLHSF